MRAEAYLGKVLAASLGIASAQTTSALKFRMGLYASHGNCTPTAWDISASAVSWEFRRARSRIGVGMPREPSHRRNKMFVEAWNKKAQRVNHTAKEKGWWDEERNDGEIIALMHSELSEALEALRHGNPPDSHIPGFKGTEAELADVVIRIMDYGIARGLRIAEAIEAKMVYNAGRSIRHGGKRF